MQQTEHMQDKHIAKYKNAFSEITASDALKQKVFNTCKAALTQEQAVSDFPMAQAPTKRKNAFSQFLFNTKKGIAVFTASIIFMVAIAVGLPMGFLFNSNNFANTISNLRNTIVDMNGVAGFGIMQLGEGEDSTPIVRGMSIGAVDGVYGSGQGTPVPLSGRKTVNGDWEWERIETASQDDLLGNYDWQPYHDSQVLITIDENGNVKEVIYEKIDGIGTISQYSLGFVDAIFVGTEFTLVTYSSFGTLSDWIIQSSLIGNIIHGNNRFGSRSNIYQTIIIHHDTGRVFPLMDMLDDFNRALGVRVREVGVVPFDGWLAVRIREGHAQKDHIHFKLRIDDDHNLYFDFVYAYQPIQNIFRDLYGNYFLLNRVLNKQVDNVLFTYERLFRGSDRRMYSKYGGTLRVFSEDLELIAVKVDLEVNLEEFVKNTHVCDMQTSFYMYGAFESVSNRGGAVYMIKNGYVFNMFGRVYTLETDGRLEFLTQMEGRFANYYAEFFSERNWWTDRGDIIGGELLVFIEERSTEGSFIRGEIVHVDFSEFTRCNRVVRFNHVVYTNSFSLRSNGQWAIANAGLNYFMITIYDGQIQLDWIAHFTYINENAMALMPTRPFVEARPIFAR